MWPDDFSLHSSSGHDLAIRTENRQGRRGLRGRRVGELLADHPRSRPPSGPLSGPTTSLARSQVVDPGTRFSARPSHVPGRGAGRGRQLYRPHGGRGSARHRHRRHDRRGRGSHPRTSRHDRDPILGYGGETAFSNVARAALWPRTRNPAGRQANRVEEFQISSLAAS